MANYPGYNPYGQQFNPPLWATGGAQMGVSPSQSATVSPMQTPQMQMQIQQQPATVQTVQTMQTAVPSYMIRAISDISEIYSAPVDFNGTPVFGWDMARGVIYRKQFNLNKGSADVQVYRLEQAAQPAQQEFVTVAQFNQFVNDVNEWRRGYAKPVADVIQHDTAGQDDAGHAKRRKSDAGGRADGAE